MQEFENMEGLIGYIKRYDEAGIYSNFRLAGWPGKLTPCCDSKPQPLENTEE
jgi:hypothetical protein